MSEETKTRIVKSHDTNLDSDYVNWIHDVKQRYISTQIKAAVKVNTERLYFNWQLGRDLVERKAVDRGDTETVHKHLDALADSEAGEVYRVLGKVLVKIAEQKYKGRDDTAMRQLFELSDRNPTEEQRISGKDET